ncbi:Hypothetical predicted protein [Xyrichtys novacula]|uniref:Interferon-induced protein 44-like n=1 Tax=Xyrichtys novacula TaxID=13765 RepID=A0AAV1GTP4_XYRNO|nr:Hypothetical predicted protein [Xyrichtys novacula]
MFSADMGSSESTPPPPPPPPPQSPPPHPSPPPAPPSPCLRQPWRQLTESSGDIIRYLGAYHPRNAQFSHLRVLLHGPVGAGKSSFINSVDSALRGRVTGRAATDATSGRSYTLEYKTYKIEKQASSFYSVVFNDIMGLEDNLDNGVQVDDVKLAMKGHVREKHKFNPQNPLSERDFGYNPDPTLDDKVHVLVCVVPVDTVSLLSDGVVQKLRQVRLAARDQGIPQFAILTKVDQACPEVGRDIRNIHKSKYLKKQVEQFSVLLGIPVNCIFLVKNYESESSTSEDISRPILTALKQMVNYGEDYVNDINSNSNSNSFRSTSYTYEYHEELYINTEGPGEEERMRRHWS